ncbi:MAG: hypothetical protein ACO3EZ_17425 [Prochlorotrichaceae cyanobacterium]
MLDLTLLLATPIAKLVLEKFYEGAATKLGEQAVELLPEKVKGGVQRLGQLIWQRGLSQKPNSDALLQAAAEGSTAHQAQLQGAIEEVLQDPDLAQTAKQLATEIYQTINITQEGKNVMNVMGGQGLQVNEKQDQPIIQIQGNPVLNFGVSEKK